MLKSARLNAHPLPSAKIKDRPAFPMTQKHDRVVAIYPGSFDPITNGHLDVIERGSRLFDRLIVSILQNEAKAPLFSVEQRMEMLRETVTPLSERRGRHLQRVAGRLCARERRERDSARHPRDLGLRVRTADGADEPPPAAGAGNRFPAGRRDVLLHQFAGW